MALAKRGAQVAIRRSHAIQCCYTSPNAGWNFSGDDDGPMGAFGVEPRIEMAADSTAHIVFDNMMDMTCMLSRRFRIFILLDLIQPFAS